MLPMHGDCARDHTTHEHDKQHAQRTRVCTIRSN
jgi:hypothetical protein